MQLIKYKYKHTHTHTYTRTSEHIDTRVRTLIYIWVKRKKLTNGSEYICVVIDELTYVTEKDVQLDTSGA